MSGPPQLDRRQLLAAAGAVLAAPAFATAAEREAAFGPGRGQDFDLGWRFHRGEGQFEAAGLDDSGWRAVDLPHDWSIEDLPPAADRRPGEVIGPFDRHAQGGTSTGFTVGGEGWYRRRFQIAGKPGRVEVLFEGVYMNSEVWLNGQRLGAHANGYTPFAYDLTPHLSASGDNVLAVRVRNLGQNSRWYSGSGIYRHVWLDVHPEPARIRRWGVGVVTERLSDAGAALAISTQLEAAGAGFAIASRIRDERGQVVWEASAPAAPEVRQNLTLASPRLWSPETPSLYVLETELRRGPTVIDRLETPFGVRVVVFDPDHGMLLNGRPTKLRGGCIHHDNGLLGGAAFDAAESRKVGLLKARGYNALRPSHNLFSPAFLAACDRHGVMVVEETFDAWFAGKRPQDYSVAFENDWKADLAAIVLSVRNHPSVLMYSIGNEIPDRNTPHGIETQWNLANECHRLDPTRPVTAAINGFPGPLVTPSEKTARAGAAGVPDHASAVFLDLVGYNYKLHDYEADRRQFPQRLFFGTESFPEDLFAIWDLTERTPWLLGDFVWTAMDYLGEAGIGGSNLIPATMNKAMGMLMPSGWPWVNSFCGDLDITGEQKAPSFARDVVWGLSPVELAVQRPPPEGKQDVARRWGWVDEAQSWTWPGAEGKPMTVRVYTAGDRVELRLNGAVVARKAVAASDLKHVALQVPYTAGVLEAVAFHKGAEIGRKRLATAGLAATVRLKPERPNGGARRGDVSFVQVELLDAKGRPVPDLARDVRLTLSGPAELIGFGSGDPQAVGGYQSPVARTWNGRALAVLRSTGRPGRVRIEAQSEGLAPAVASVTLV